MALRPVTDKEILDALVAIDVSPRIRVTALDAEFLDETFYSHGEWTVEQRARAAKIAEKYRHQL